MRTIGIVLLVIFVLFLIGVSGWSLSRPPTIVERVITATPQPTVQPTQTPYVIEKIITTTPAAPSTCATPVAVKPTAVPTLTCACRTIDFTKPFPPDVIVKNPASWYNGTGLGWPSAIVVRQINKQQPACGVTIHGRDMHDAGGGKWVQIGEDTHFTLAVGTYNLQDEKFKFPDGHELSDRSYAIGICTNTEVEIFENDPPGGMSVVIH